VNLTLAITYWTLICGNSGLQCFALNQIIHSTMATADDDAPDIEECRSMQREEFEVLEVCTLKTIVFR